ncbi:MAG: XRE family transcriptional regulator [Sciscionella sp.]
MRGVTVITSTLDESIDQALGNELRRRREELRWSREQLCAQLPSGICVQTLCSYEHGKRAISIRRLWELCASLDCRPHDVLAVVHRRVAGEHALAGDGSTPAAAVSVELTRLATVRDPRLAPLRRWAHASIQHGRSTVVLTTTAMAQIEVLCAMTAAELVASLHQGAAVTALSPDDAVPALPRVSGAF